MKKSLLLIAVLFFYHTTSFAQFSLSKGFSNLEFSGSVQTFYNYRFYKSDSDTKKKNRFALDYAQFSFRGYADKFWRYKVDVDFAALANNTANSTSDDGGFLSEASIMYRGINHLDIEIGYSKLPFSRSSMLSKEDVPFLQRPEVARGDVFSRRDLGVTLTANFLDQKLKIYGGIYNGTGEAGLGNDNDDSGNPEFLVRTELSYPAPFDEAALDKVNSPVPVISLGLNGRYARKSEFTGAEYGIITIDGKKYSYGGDLALKYKGLLATLEILEFRMQPDDSTSALLSGQPTDFVRSGAFIAELSYYYNPLRTAIAIRYDEYNPSDLMLKDTRKNISAALNYFFNGNSTLRIHYWHRLDLESTQEPWTDDQLRLAWLIQF